MIIQAISDTHGRHKDLKILNGDVLVCAGDISNSRNRFNNLKETIDFLEWFSSTNFEHKILVAGNHDYTLFEKKISKDVILNKYGIIYLEDDSVIIENIKFHGFPWALPFYDWCFYCDEEEMSRKASLINNDTDVIISHGPAYGINDLAKRNVNTGSVSLLNRVLEVEPKVLINGHIHEDRNIKKIKNTIFANVANYSNEFISTTIEV